jgi:zinc protease
MKIMRYFFALSLFFLFSLIELSAQEDLSKHQLPVDPKVKIGRLENGFTYYIRENKKPEKRVEMRLVVNAGSVLEDEDQLGLAHFVEHMAFNGTTHFEKNELKNYLESIGIRFGPELNAYTSFDETVYMLTIPSDSVNLLDKGFLVMEDWAHGLTFDEVEIDKERGIIVEEWRRGQGFNQRLRDKYLPVVYHNSKYAERLPIGKKETIENCNYESLRRFYRDWYRPDLMALVIVGDIESGYVEEKIKNHFSSLTIPENSRERVVYDVPDNEGTLSCIVTDKEAPYNMIFLLNKNDARIQNTFADFLYDLRYTFITGILNQRLIELTELENPPIISASFSYGGLGARNKDALQGFVLVGDGGVNKGLETILQEVERVDRYGFTSGEWKRYRMDLLKRYETAFAEREKTESRKLADEYKRNFLDKEPIPGIEFEYAFVKENIDKITLEEINDLAAKIISPDNRIIVIGAPEDQTTYLPAEQDVLSVAKKVNESDLVNYVDEQVATELMVEKPVPGSILTEKSVEKIGAIDLELSNGVRVILKPTDFKNDEVMLSAFSMGGHSVYPDEDHFTALNADGIIKETGVGDYSVSDISKILAGKSVYVAPFISYETEGITANSKTSDIESMLQLIYLYFTDLRDDSSSFNSYVIKKKKLFENLSKEPQNFFFDKYYRIKSQDHPRGDYLPTSEDWEGIDYERAREIYRDRFSDAENFTFIMVGSFDPEIVKPLLKQYIASLPTWKREESFIDLKIRPPHEKTREKVYRGSDPKSLAMIYFEKEIPWNEYDAFMINALKDLLSIRYVDLLREEMSGVYTIRVNAGQEKIPYEHAWMQIMIPCAPESADTLISVSLAEIVKIQREGVDPELIGKVKEAQKRSLQVKLQDNQFWMNTIQDALMLETDLNNMIRKEYIDKISSEEIQRVASQYIDADRYLEVILFPETEDGTE